MGKVVSALPIPVNTRRLANALAPRGVEDVLVGAAMMEAEVPAANGFFTARSLGRLYAMLAAGGELDGVRVLSPETVAEAATVQSHGLDLVLVVPMDWRLGYHRVFTSRGTVGPRVRALRLRWIGRLGGPEPRPVGRLRVQPRKRHADR
jgi:CubicO group peptidase (beta-lactamase class C family)